MTRTRLVDRCRCLLALFAVLAVLGAAVPTPALGAMGTNEEAPLDLAALALTPADLESEGLDGYGLAGGKTRTPAAIAAAFAFERDLPDDEALDLFAGAGLRQGYRLRLERPAGDGVASSVISTLHEYGGDSGAADAFAALTDWDGIATAEEIRGDETIGDESRLTRHTGATGEPFAALDLAFRTGRIVAVVRIVDFSGDEPAVTDAERLAERLLERIERGLDDRETGLPAQALRVGGAGVIRSQDYYTVLAGTGSPTKGEHPDDAAAYAEAAAAAGMTDEYVVAHRLSVADEPTGEAYLNVLVQRFADEDAASNYLHDSLADQAESELFENLEEIDDLAEYGDEAIAFTQTFRWESRDVDLIYQSYYLRAGSRLALVQIVAAQPPPLATLEELAAAQAACLTSGDCLEPTPLPADLQAMVGTDSVIGYAPGAGRHRAQLPSRERTWTGETFGVELTYATGTWRTAGAISDEDGDTLIVGDMANRTLVTLSAIAGDDSAEACVVEFASMLSDEEARGQARPIWDGSGEPIVGGDDERAFGAYAVATDDGQRPFFHVECFSFADGEATLMVVAIGPLERYEPAAENLEVLLDGLVLPDQ